MKRLLLAAIVLLLVSPCMVYSAQKELKPQTQCPVMGEKIDKKVYVDYQGQRVYFCCPACKDTFLKDPEKYFAKFEKAGVLLESVQKKCPVMGGDIDNKEYTDYKGRRVYFCCAGCKDKFLAEPDKYLNKIE